MRHRPLLLAFASGLLAALPLAGADTPIHELQGTGASSPLVRQSVTATGVVSALRTSGFYLQAPDPEADADPATGCRVRAKRQAQAEDLATLLARLQSDATGAPSSPSATSTPSSSATASPTCSGRFAALPSRQARSS